MAAEKLLLIWEEIPENVKAYVLDVDSPEAELARLSAGGYINVTDFDADSPIVLLKADLAKIEGVEPEKVLVGPFAEVVVCGIVL
jgi:hypothetical protein